MKRRDFVKATALGATAWMLGSRSAEAEENGRRNVLFLYVDDLRPQLKCYGVDWMVTPHIDRLAAEGTLFERAYSQYPICGPSRSCTLSGLRPTPSRFMKWNSGVDAEVPGTLTLPQHFKERGYHTRGVGKIFHDLRDCHQAWSDGVWMPDRVLGRVLNSYMSPENRELTQNGGVAPAFERAGVEDGVYGDGKIAERAISDLQVMAARKQPFFYAAGFLRPHLPFCAPEKYWALYDGKVPMPPNPYPPRNVPPDAMHTWGELRNYGGIPAEGPLDEATARTLIHGYAASVSYLDAQVGRVLAEVDRLGLRENTLIVFMTDHGWQLGEHGLWAKHCLFDNALHCPLIFRGPGVAAGGRAWGLVEYVDVYPTLCETTGLPIPGHLEGRSFAPMLRDAAQPGREAAFSRHSNGDSVKTDRFRYSEWRDDHGNITARTLFDHEVDPQENVNLSDDSAFRDSVRELSDRIAAQRSASQTAGAMV